MLGAIQTQFPPDLLAIRLEPFIRARSKLQRILSRAREEKAAICHAMVSTSFKAIISRFCRTNALPCCDLTGGVVQFVARITGAAPRADIKSLHRIDGAYRRRISALEYAISHDDGLGLATLHEADAVLVGVSRTSKTPTSIYLAEQGYRIANVSIVEGTRLPEELLALSPERVIGLYIDPEQLVMIRHRRQAALGVKDTPYALAEDVEREIAWACRVFSAQGWKSLNVTDQAIEETAGYVLAHIAGNKLGSSADRCPPELE